MPELLRRLRGAIGIGMTWGVLWAVIGLALGLIIGHLRPGDIGPGEGLGKVAVVFGLLGLCSGLSFAGILSVAERRRTIHELSLGRVALWGSVGAAALPLLFGTDGAWGE
jgi:hypothetical protein